MNPLTDSNQKKIQESLLLQVTGMGGAEGKDQTVFLNSDEVKRALICSLAGPESSNP